ncbi:cytochrome P450 [Tsukamurella strandjordii]|uniref:Cytochrome P450 n=1 Tax=Tsukamurella strandjordii TaxID=147577 RepID=A0AA90NG92_9ACTN|nr:cytochrome P450 [Tsukamurella strandjordii]MDP0398578.1 cytochrome P450 [Tsukamurella strandjordii]
MYRIEENRNVWPVAPKQVGRRVPIIGDMTRGSVMSPIGRLVETTTPGRHDVFGIRFFGQNYVFTGEPDLAAEVCDDVLFEKAHAPSLYALREFIGDGLFSAYNDESAWTDAHELLAPAFSREAMRAYHDTMCDVADELVVRWRATDSVDVSHEMTRATFETIARAGFGRPYNLLVPNDDRSHPLVRASEVLLRTSLVKSAVHALPAGGLIELGADRYAAKHRRFAREHLGGIVDEMRRRGPERNGTDRATMLELMVHGSESRPGLDGESAFYQLLTFLIAGHETTSGTMAFALYYLSRDRELLEQAKAEADAAFEATGEGRDLAFEAVPRLRFLRRVVDESLRMWPTVPGMARQPKHDHILGGRYRMRPDNWVVLFFHHLHRHPDVWDRPNAFDPSRFESAAVRARPAHVYKPFGTGARACIGRQFAIHEALVILARLLHEFDIESDPDYRLRVDERLTLIPKDFRLSLRDRQ